MSSVQLANKKKSWRWNLSSVSLEFTPLLSCIYFLCIIQFISTNLCFTKYLEKNVDKSKQTNLGIAPIYNTSAINKSSGTCTAYAVTGDKHPDPVFKLPAKMNHNWHLKNRALHVYNYGELYSLPASFDKRTIKIFQNSLSGQKSHYFLCLFCQRQKKSEH